MAACEKITLPPDAASLLAALHSAGFTAYVVGGCVRDSLLGRTPGDWDICTSARPAQIKRVFSACRQILTGEKHGTVTVIVGKTPYEITTYRVDGAYTDNRHPNGVRFVPDIRQDLSRRDFTVNAMAYAPGVELVDAFGGQADLQAGLIRCVGCPQDRFAEDALRILRALRFAAQLGFDLEADTLAAARALRDTVACVSAERIFIELDKLLAGPAAGAVLARYGAVLGGVLPEILPCIGCTQPGRWHCYDVWQHTAVAVQKLDTTGHTERSARILRWAVLLHDMAKPLCRTLGTDGAAHFYGHNQRGTRLAHNILRRLKAPAYLIDEACALVAVHDAPLPEDDPGILQMLGRSGATFLRRLCRVKCADLDAHAQTPAVAARRVAVTTFAQRMETLAQTGCYTIGQLQVGGGDVLACGIRPGPHVGEALQALLQAVIEGRLPNERQALLDALDRL